MTSAMPQSSHSLPILCALFLCSIATALAGPIVYADPSSNATVGCGTSWADACPTLELAVKAACSQNASDINTILAAPGDYAVSMLDIPCHVNLLSTNGSRSTTIRAAEESQSATVRFQFRADGAASFVGFSFVDTWGRITRPFLSFSVYGGGTNITIEDVQFPSTIYEDHAISIPLGADTVTISQVSVEPSVMSRSFLYVLKVNTFVLNSFSFSGAHFETEMQHRAIFLRADSMQINNLQAVNCTSLGLLFARGRRIELQNLLVEMVNMNNHVVEVEVEEVFLSGATLQNITGANTILSAANPSLRQIQVNNITLLDMQFEQLVDVPVELEQTVDLSLSNSSFTAVHAGSLFRFGGRGSLYCGDLLFEAVELNNVIELDYCVQPQFERITFQGPRLSYIESFIMARQNGLDFTVTISDSSFSSVVGSGPADDSDIGLFVFERPKLDTLNVWLVLDSVNASALQIPLVIGTPSRVLISDCHINSEAHDNEKLVLLDLEECANVTIVNTRFLGGEYTSLLLLHEISSVMLSSVTFEELILHDVGIGTSKCNLVELFNVSVKDCRVSSSSGSFIGAVESALTVDNLWAHSAEATEGGVLRLSNAVANLTNCNFTSVHAERGGAIFLSQLSHLRISDSSFEYCTADNIGGCLWVGGYASCHLENTRFAHSTSKLGGGAVFVLGAAHLTGNVVTIFNCSSWSGGALMLSEYSTTSIDRLSLVNCSAELSGGGFVASVNSSATFNRMVVANCSLNANAEGGAGGTVQGFSSVAISNSLLTNNRANIQFGQGGALMGVDSSSIWIDASAIEFNRAAEGGAISTSYSSSLTVTNTVFQNNTAKILAGCIYADRMASLNVQECHFLNNHVTRGGGGAIGMKDSSTLLLEGSNFTNNAAVQGGAIFGVSRITLAMDVRISNSTFVENKGDFGGALRFDLRFDAYFKQIRCVNNTGFVRGGCLYAHNTNITSEENVIENNRSPFGAGFYIDASSRYNETGSVFRNNVSPYEGGAVYIEGGLRFAQDITLIRTVIEFNSAAYGGGVAVGDLFPLSHRFEDCIFRNNSAEELGGGVYFFYTITPRETFQEEEKFAFVNATLFGNSARRGGAIFLDMLHHHLSTFGPACKLIANYAEYGAGLFFETYQPSAVVTIMHNGTFARNWALYGGSNVGFKSIANVSQAYDFCENCFFGEPSASFTGYQTIDGFASIPSRTGVNTTTSDGCPTFVTLDAAPIDFLAVLKDDFHTVVQGPYLDSPFVITLEWTIPTGEVLVSNVSSIVQPDNGTAEFDDVSFCGENGSTFRLNFVPEDAEIPDYTCSITLQNCSKSTDVIMTDKTCNYCAPRSLSIPTILLLLVMSFLVLVAIAVLLLLYRKKLRRDRMRALKVPDLEGRMSLSLEDILNDPAIPRLSWKDVTVGEVIGKGASGLVKEGTWTQGSSVREIALKELMIGFDQLTTEAAADFFKEIKYMSVVMHDNVVQFLGVLAAPDGKTLHLVTELMHKGSVHDIIAKKSTNLPMSLRMKMAMDTAKGMAFLHSKKLIHRDLKTQNLLVNDEWETKVGDLGISTVKPTITRKMTCVGTPVYMAPEVLQRNAYSERADVYSFSIVMAEIFTCRLPYSHEPFIEMNSAQLMYQITENSARPDIEDLHPTLQNLITECWSTDPYLRPTFAEIVARLRRLRRDLTIPSRVDSDPGYGSPLRSRALPLSVQTPGDPNVELTSI